MKDYNSVLQFLTYKVNKIEFRTNDNFKEGKKGIPIKLSIIPIVNVEKENMNITLKTEIFKDAEENNFPFEMIVELTGYFKCEGDAPDKFVRNAVAILYPYVRSIVSTYTSNANISPLILPTINVNTLIEEQQKKDLEPKS